MTKEQAKRAGDILLAWSNGETIQYANPEYKDKWTDQNEPYIPRLAQAPEMFRVKPKPTYRPWTPEEVPVGALIRSKRFNKQKFLITGINWESSKSEVFIGHTSFSAEHCLDNEEVSLDNGKTWQPAGTKVEDC